MEGDLIMAWEEFKVSGVTEKTPKNINIDIIFFNINTIPPKFLHLIFS